MTETPQTAVDEFVASTTGGAREPKIVTLSDGSFVVAYSTPDGDGSGFEIRGQLFDQNGNKIGAEFLFDFLDDIEVPEFDIASMGGNRVAIVAEVENTQPLDPQIKALLFSIDEDGASAGNGLFVSDLDSPLSNPTIAGIGDDDFSVHYVHKNYGFRSVREIHLEDEAVSDRVRVKKFDGEDEAELNSDTLDNGNIVLILDRDGAGGNGKHIHLRVMRPDGSTVESGDIRTPDGRAIDSTVSALRGDGFVVAWTDDDGFDNDLQFQVFNSDGSERTPVLAGPRVPSGPFVIDPDGNNEPTIAALEDGGFIIFYDDDEGVAQVRGQRYDSDGDKLGDNFLVASENGAQLDATLLEDGRVAVTYHLVGEGEIKVEIIDPDGHRIVGTTGDDTVNGTNDDDIIVGFGGDDVLAGRRGDDEIRGGSGSDELHGEKGNDRLLGGGGDDVLLGEQDNDDLNGGSGNDTLDGGRGSDILTGGLGNDILIGSSQSDTFVFRNNHGNDRILDFDANDDAEVIDLSEVVAIASFNDLSSNHMSQDGNDVVIDDLSGTTITLQGVDLGDLDAADFVF